jgi:hypothetical protein
MGLLGPTCWLAPPRPLRIPARHVSHARVSGVFLGCYAAGNECGRRYLEMSRTIACSALPGRCAPRPGAGTAAGPAIRPASRSHNGLEARRLVYREELLVGYRGYDHAGTRPRFPFGHGLGYTTWTCESAVADRDGARAGRQPGRDRRAPQHRAADRTGGGLGLPGAAGRRSGPPGAGPGRIHRVRPLRSGGRDLAPPPGEFIVRGGRSSAHLPLQLRVRSS